MKSLSILLFAVTAWAQPANTVTIRAVNNITSTATVLDNRSTSLGQNYAHTFCVTGIGTWSVTIEYSTTGVSGWTAFADGSATVSNTSVSCVGAASGYHPYLRFNITGTVSINYTGEKTLYIPTGAGSGSGGLGPFNTITTGTNTTATMTVGSGASLVRTGTGIIDANKILGTTLTGLTGIIQMTAGIPSIITSSNVIALWTGTCNTTTWLRGDGACTTPGGAGTVVSVQNAATGIFAFTGGPVTGTGTLTLTQTGTSGGIPYFSDSATLSTSAALALNQIMLGGGAGAAPFTLGTTGTATTLLHGGTTTPSFSQVANADIANATIVLTTKVTGILPSANGGTNNAFFAVSGPATSAKTYTFPNTNSTILTTNTAVTVPQGGSGATTLTGVLLGNAASPFTAIALPVDATQYLNGIGAFSVPTMGIGEALRSGTAQSVIYVGSGPVVAQDNTNFFYDPAAKLLTVTGGVSTGDGTVAGELVMGELAANGTNYRSWFVPDALTATLRMKFPDTVPAAGDVMTFGAPSSSISQIAFQSVASAATASTIVSRDANADFAGHVVTTLNVRTTPVAVGSLPTCNAGSDGMRAMVNDANATLTAGIGAVVANGGGNHVPVVCDAGAWRIG